MPRASDPTIALKIAAARLSGAVEGEACNQSSFKAGKRPFLFVGPGAKGVGYKAMFKLEASLKEAKQLAKKEPDRFEVGGGNWVTTRFSSEKPLPRAIWSRWLKESYAGATSRDGTVKKKTTKVKAEKKRKKTAKKSSKKRGTKKAS